MEVVLFCFIALCSFTTVLCCNSTSLRFWVDSSRNRILDCYGRERIFHGSNVVFKASPWLPITGNFDPLYSLAQEDIFLMKRLGMNVVRLGVMWPGLEPIRGQFNETYIQEVKRIIDRLACEGIFTLVEFHQDIFSDTFCGEGFPSWLFDKNDAQKLLGPTPAYSRKLLRSTIESESDHWTGSSALPIQEFPKQNRGNGEISETNEGENAKVGFPCIGLAVCMTPSQYALTFPEPLGEPFFLNNLKTDDDAQRGNNPEGRGIGEHGERRSTSDRQRMRHFVGLNGPTVAQCEQHPWGAYHMTFAVARAYQDMYENRWGWRDLFCNFWRKVANSLRSSDGILGYEIINEPWAGDVYANPLLFVPGVADKRNFLPFYDHVQAAIREEDPFRLIFFESLTFDNLRIGFDRVPGGKQFANMSVLSYHFYRPPNLAVQNAFAERAKEMKKLKCGGFLTEFNNPWNGLSSEESLAVLAAADAHAQSWTMWEFKQYVNITGPNSGLFSDDGTVNLGAAQALSRTYPQAVAGSVFSFNFNPSSGRFILIYTAGWPSLRSETSSSESSQGSSPLSNAGSGPRHDLRAAIIRRRRRLKEEWQEDKKGVTEIWYSREFYYPNGVTWQIMPKGLEVINAEEEGLLFVVHKQEDEGQQVTLHLLPKSPEGAQHQRS